MLFMEKKIAQFDFNGELIEGDFPSKQTKLVQAWVEIHKKELEANWELAKNSERPYKILPLK